MSWRRRSAARMATAGRPMATASRSILGERSWPMRRARRRWPERAIRWRWPPSIRQRPSAPRSEEHTSELQSLMRISYAVFCLKKKKYTKLTQHKYYKRLYKTDKQETQDLQPHRKEE